MSVKNLSLFSFLAALVFLSACGTSKKPLALNENILAKPIGAPVWYTTDNILAKGNKGMMLYSSPDLFRKNAPSGSGAYALRFSPTTLLEMTRFPANDSTLDVAVVKPAMVNAPYYFVTAKGKRTLGIWQSDAYRIYLVYRFVAFKNKGGYIVELLQLQ